MTVKKILVTGGAGFIGSQVAGALVDAGHTVAIIDDLSSGKKSNLPEQGTFFEFDIRSPRAAEIVVEFSPEIIYHLAAQMDVRKSVADPRFDADVNIGGILNLLNAGINKGLKKVVFASTGGAIYGDQSVFPATESHAEWPLSPYGITKLATEKYLYFYHREYGLEATCLRYANVYGPRQNAYGEAGVVAIFIGKLLSGESPTIFGDGKNTRDYTFVADVVRANLKAMDASGYNIFNVGTGTETTVNALYGTIAELLNCDIAPTYAPARPGEQRRSSIEATKLRQELGLTIETGLTHGLAQTVAWYTQNHRGAPAKH